MIVAYATHAVLAFWLLKAILYWNFSHLIKPHTNLECHTKSCLDLMHKHKYNINGLKQNLSEKLYLDRKPHYFFMNDESTHTYDHNNLRLDTNKLRSINIKTVFFKETRYIFFLIASLLQVPLVYKWKEVLSKNKKNPPKLQRITYKCLFYVKQLLTEFEQVFR